MYLALWACRRPSGPDQPRSGRAQQLLFQISGFFFKRCFFGQKVLVVAHRESFDAQARAVNTYVEILRQTNGSISVIEYGEGAAELQF